MLRSHWVWVVAGLWGMGLWGGCAEVLGLEDGRLQGECESRVECAPDYTCFRGKCLNACASDAECGPGRRCVRSFQDSACESVDDVCDNSTAPCPPGTRCDPSWSVPVCVANCDRDADCFADQHCEDRACVSDDPRHSPQPIQDAGMVVGSSEFPGNTVPMQGAPCGEPDATACMGDAQQRRLVCEQGKWNVSGNCGDAELCDRRTGLCAQVAPGCAGQAPGGQHCEGNVLVVCGPDLVSVERLPCGGACVESQGGAACASADCGDGMLQPGEACDDGDTSSSNACTSLCREARCGDGFVQKGVEVCDDGNDQDGDSCPSTCEPARCGDGFVLVGVEDCDDGNNDDSDACDSRCKRPDCGDGILQPGERCDDGNATSGDGCSSGCTPEPIELAMGDYHACARFAGGQVKCWGDNSYGQLGLNDQNVRGDDAGEMGLALPVVALGTGVSASSLVAGDFHNCVTFADGRSKCWGQNSYGQLGLGDKDNRGNGNNLFGESVQEMGDRLPVLDLGAGRRAIQLEPGNGWTCALREDQSVTCFGYNLEGELGLGDYENRGDESGETGDNLRPVDLGDDATAMALAARWGHTCALLKDGRIKCWGMNLEGELGQGSIRTRGDNPGEMGNALLAVDLGEDFVPVAMTAGRAHNCVLSAQGQVKCWGANLDGQLGIGDTRGRGDDPGELGGRLPFVSLGGVATQLAAGFDHTCAVLEGGQVKCWGFNFYGQLGLGDTRNRGDNSGEMGTALPTVDLGAGRSVRALSAGGHHTCAILDDASVKCWGLNESGQLGLGDVSTRGDQVSDMGDNLKPVVLW